MSLGHADREVVEALPRVSLYLHLGLRQELNVVRSVDLLRNGSDLVLDAEVEVVEELEVGLVFGGSFDGARQFNEFQGLKGEWTRFGERLKKQDIDDKEWEGVPLLLRRVYDAGDDMLYMAKGAFQRRYFQTYLPRTTSTTGNRASRA